MKFKILTCIGAAALALGVSQSSLATPVAEVTFNWGSSFQVQLTDLNSTDGITPSITWLDQSSMAYAFAGPPAPAAYHTFTDWTTSLTSTDGVANATADASALGAWITPAPAAGSNIADSQRSADFLISANTEAVFSVNASAMLNLPANASNTADAWLGTVGGDNPGYNLSHIGLVGSGVPQSNSGLLSATIVNSTNSEVPGSMFAEATVNAVPEPATLALTLIGLVGFAVRRRQG